MGKDEICRHSCNLSAHGNGSCFTIKLITSRQSSLKKRSPVCVIINSLSKSWTTTTRRNGRLPDICHLWPVRSIHFERPVCDSRRTSWSRYALCLFFSKTFAITFFIESDVCESTFFLLFLLLFFSLSFDYFANHSCFSQVSLLQWQNNLVYAKIQSFFTKLICFFFCVLFVFALTTH